MYTFWFFFFRFFVNDGEAKTGLKLDKALPGGYVGFLSRGLSTQTHVVWDTILCGPLWVQIYSLCAFHFSINVLCQQAESTFSLQNAFGSGNKLFLSSSKNTFFKFYSHYQTHDFEKKSTCAHCFRE
jgi:hypothetical protein